MSEQSYANHVRWVPGYHFVLSPIVVVLIAGGVVDVVRAVQRGSGRLEAGLVLLTAVALGLVTWYLRVFPLKAQDRAIRAEENLRHYVLTGSLLDSRLTPRQIVGLRFASDAELPELARRAVGDGLSEDAIKRAIQTWRADTYRV